METMTIDVAFDEGLGETVGTAVAELTAGLAVGARVLRERGPGGGWPEVELSGSAADLAEVRRRGGYDGADD